MKQTRHSLMAKGIMVLLSLLILAFVITFAWFIDPDSPVTASGLSLSTKSDADFQMAIGFSNSDTSGNYYITDFTDSENTKIDFERLHVTKNAKLANNVTTYNTTLSTDTATYNLLSDFKPIDLTGDGITLFRPEMTFKNRSINFSAATVDKSIVDNKQFISFDLYIRSTSQAYAIALDSGSYVLAACEVDNTQSNMETLDAQIANGTKVPSVSMKDHSKLVNTTVLRPSKYSENSSKHFSEDCVIGAVRISFAQYNPVTNLADFVSTKVTPADAATKLDADTRKVWIPRSDIYLQDTQNADDWTLVTSSDTGVWSSTDVTFQSTDEMNNGRTITYKNAAAEHRYYDESKMFIEDPQNPGQQILNPNIPSRFSTIDGVITDIAQGDDNIIVEAASLSNNDPVFDGTYYYGKCRINLWVEGCDAEARRAIDGGSFVFGFDLSGR